MKLSSYLITIAYDGTSYAGWQFQPIIPTVVSTLCTTFQRAFHCSVHIKGASRTDAGVHALGQIAIMQTVLDLDPRRIQRVWNGILPIDIHIRNIIPLSSSCNIHEMVHSKTYYYHFFTERSLPGIARYGYFYRYPVNVDILQEALQVFHGTHDFRSFCTGDEMGSNTIRTIDHIDLEYSKQYKMYRISISGKRFLKYMIRRIVGAALEVATQNRFVLNDLHAILNACNSKHHLPTAPAHGLVLRKIIYTINKD